MRSKFSYNLFLSENSFLWNAHLHQPQLELGAQCKGNQLNPITNSRKNIKYMQNYCFLWTGGSE